MKFKNEENMVLKKYTFLIVSIFLLLLNSSLFSLENSSCEVCHENSYYTGKHKNIQINSEILNSGSHRGFNCVDCHFVGFEDYPHEKTPTPITCGKCHKEQEVEYENSSHFKARLKGIQESPDCSDCHNVHDIKKPSKELHGHNSIAVCTSCHSNFKENNSFKIKSSVVASYKSSYHGQQYNLGLEGDNLATCVSCHDNHSILDKDNKQSTIAKANIVKTCQQCHKEADENFASYLTHFDHKDDDNPILSFVSSFMHYLLWGTLSIFGLHTLLWFLRSITLPKHNVKEDEKYIQRFDSSSRFSHVVLVVSFLLLALAGLPLKFSDSSFSIWIANNIIGFEMAALVHRIAAMVMGLLFIVHLVILFKKRKTLSLFGTKSLIPNLQDLRDFFSNMAFFLHLRKDPPKFGKFTYWEKFDYLAVFWGVFVIGGSGLILMAPIAATKFVPGWFINLAHIVHSDEALLATAYIFVVHFFNTHLRPNAFPLDDVIFTGQISLTSFKEERKLEYEELVEKGKLEDQFVKRMETKSINLWRLFGFTMLFIGIVFLILIIVSV